MCFCVSHKPPKTHGRGKRGSCEPQKTHEGPFCGSCVFYGLCEPQKTHDGGKCGLRGF